MVLLVALGACSSKDSASPTGTTSVEPATSATTGGGTATSAGSGSATTAVGAVGTNPSVNGGSLAPLEGETIQHYYQRIGMPDALAQCYTTALTKLGVTDLHQLESNQALGARATAQFEACAKANPVGRG